MEKNKEMKTVVMYQASIKFAGKFYTTPATESLDETLGYVKRAREKSTSTNLVCNIIQVLRYVPA